MKQLSSFFVVLFFSCFLLNIGNANAAPTVEQACQNQKNRQSADTLVYTEKKTGIEFPFMLADFFYVKVFDFEPMQAGLGVSVKYTNCITKVDVIVYNAGLKSILSDQVRQYFKKAINDIHTLVDMGMYKDLQVKEDATVTIGRNTFLHATFNYTETARKHNEDRTVSSELYMTSYKNQFIKIRLTSYSPDQQQAINDFMQAIAVKLN